MLPIFVSIPSNGSSLFQSITSPASLEIFRFVWSQSPQTGQVYFNVTHVPSEYGNYLWAVSIPSNGSSLFQFYSHLCHHLSSQVGSQSPQTGQVYFNAVRTYFNSYRPGRCVSIPSNGSSLFQLDSNSKNPQQSFSLNPLKRVKFISI